jgi:hypothetical protein
MTIESNSHLDKSLTSPSSDSSDLSLALSREGNPVGPTENKHSDNKMAHNPAKAKRFEGVDIAAAELLPEFFQGRDIKQERLNLLHDQLAKLYPATNPNSANTIARFERAFEDNYAIIAPELDGFESSTRFRGSKNQDLATRQELMDWTNRAAANGFDNRSPRLTHQQQANLDALEAVDTPNPGADATLRAKLDRLQMYEKYIAAVRNKAPTTGLKWNSNDYKGLQQDPDVKQYLTQQPGQPASGGRQDRLDGILNNSEPHHVADTMKRWGELEQICKDFKNRQKTPSTDDAYWRADAERKALKEVNTPKSLGETIAQEDWRTLLIAQDLVGLTSQGTYSLRRFRDGKFDGNNLPNPLDDASKIPKDAKAIIDNLDHNPGNTTQIAQRLSSLQNQCEQDRQFSQTTNIMPFENYEFWARIAERNALEELRGTTQMQRQARALIVKQELLGLSPVETKTLRQLRDTIYAGKDH